MLNFEYIFITFDGAGLSFLGVAFLEAEEIYVMLYASWCHFYNLENVKNTHGEVLLLGKLQAFSLQLC